jgi:hypothetical protein
MALLRHNANINAFYRGKTPLMRALKYTSAAVRELVVFDGQVQQVAVLKFDIVSPDAGLQFKIEVFA